MTEFLGFFKDIFFGGGSLKEVGIRILLLLVGSMGAILLKIFHSNLNKIMSSNDKLDKKLGLNITVQDKFHDELHKTKRELLEMMLKNTDLMRTESHSLRKMMMDLDKELTKTQLSLSQSHETREDIYHFIKTLNELQKNNSDLYGRVILIEGFKTKYQNILEQFEKIIESRKKKN